MHMNGNDDIVVGLDIGTTKVVCMVGRKNEFGKIEVLGLGKSESLGVTRGVVSNIEKTVNSIREAVSQAEENANVDIKVVNVGIAGQHIRSLQLRGQITRKSSEDEINQIDIDSLIENMYRLPMQPGEEIIHVLPQEYIVDQEPGIKEPIGMSGIILEANFHIITGQLAAAKNIHRCVTKADLEVEDLILEPLASAEAVLSHEEKEAGVVLVDVGGGTTDIAIFHEGIIRHTAVIPFGGNVLSEDIKTGCMIMKKQAEQLKIKFGSALSNESQVNEIVCIPGLRGRDPKEISVKNLAHIIQARMEEIIEQVYYEIKNSGYENQLIGGIVLTGGGAMLKNVSQLTEYITGLDTRIGHPTEHVANSEGVANPMYSTCVGLVIKGFEKLEKIVEKPQVTTHSKKDGGKFFKSILEKGREFLEGE
jgi:cell division protein FtsA